MISRRTFLAASAASAALAGVSLPIGPDHLPGHRVRVFGVGGGGMNALRAIQPLVTGLADVVALNTDVQDLHKTAAPYKHQLGAELTKGLGAGANPEMGRRAALGDRQVLHELVEGASTVLLVAGLGGGTGTGALPVMAELAGEANARAIAVVSLPFWFEGRRRLARAQEGLASLNDVADVVIPLPNQALIAHASGPTTMKSAFQLADQTTALVTDAMRVTAMLSGNGAMLSLSRRGLGGAGVGAGTDPRSAVVNALQSPMMEDLDASPNEVLVHLRGLSPTPRCELYSPSRRRRAPTSPGFEQRSASTTIRSFYFAVNERRFAFEETSVGGTASSGFFVGININILPVALLGNLGGRKLSHRCWQRG